MATSEGSEEQTQEPHTHCTHCPHLIRGGRGRWAEGGVGLMLRVLCVRTAATATPHRLYIWAFCDRVVSYSARAVLPNVPEKGRMYFVFDF